MIISRKSEIPEEGSINQNNEFGSIVAHLNRLVKGNLFIFFAGILRLFFWVYQGLNLKTDI